MLLAAPFQNEETGGMMPLPLMQLWAWLGEADRVDWTSLLWLKAWVQRHGDERRAVFGHPMEGIGRHQHCIAQSIAGRKRWACRARSIGRCPQASPFAISPARRIQVNFCLGKDKIPSPLPENRTA
jgi:hypothetical protein